MQRTSILLNLKGNVPMWRLKFLDNNIFDIIDDNTLLVYQRIK